MEHEMNFIDLCVACGRAIGRGCKACGRMLGQMTRLTYRYWWIVITFIALAIAAALYYSRDENLTFRVNAVALLNGPTIPQFEQAYSPLRTGVQMSEDAAILPFLRQRIIKDFTTYPVIDCLNDGWADMIDFKHKTQPTDTVNVIMQDRLCLQFRIKARNLHLIPAIEQATLDLLNSNEAMQKSYEVYIKDLRDEVSFNHRQIVKLDSLTSHYYYHTPSGHLPNAYVGNGVNFYGERRIHIFLDKIYDQQEHTRQIDYRLQLATAPVVLENHFVLDPKPLNGRKKCVILFFLLGWIAGCAFAEMIDKRKAIIAWLRGE